MKPSRAAAARPRAVKPDHPLQWLAEPLLAEPTFSLKSWFGGRTIMLHGCHQLFLTTQGEPWQGVLVCTFHAHHASLRADFPALHPHPVLGKWLYLPETADTFEADAAASCNASAPATPASASRPPRRSHAPRNASASATNCNSRPHPTERRFPHRRFWRAGGLDAAPIPLRTDPPD